MVAAAAITGGAALAGGIYEGNQAASAARNQTGAASQAANQQTNEFNTIQNEQQPYMQAGYGALNRMSDLLGTSGNTSANGYGSLTQGFTNANLNANLAPNYQFMLNQGLGQAQSQYNANGGLVGGNAMQGLNTFAQNYAENAYQDAFNNYNATQGNIYNRLASLAGLGQTSTSTTGAQGLQATNNAGNYLTSGAAAQAAGQIGSANALTSGIGGAANMYALSSLLKGGGNVDASAYNTDGMDG